MRTQLSLDLESEREKLHDRYDILKELLKAKAYLDEKNGISSRRSISHHSHTTLS